METQCKKKNTKWIFKISDNCTLLLLKFISSIHPWNIQLIASYKYNAQ